MRSVSAHVETGVHMAYNHGTAAWVFDVGLWGVCGQGTDEGGALRDLSRQLGPCVEIVVVERVYGDGLTFERDHRPCTPEERRATLEILKRTRQEMLALLRSCSEAELDSEELNRSLPSWVRWPTVRQVGWRVADHECRSYLPAAGLPARAPQADLLDELTASAAHVRAHVCQIPSDLVAKRDGKVWTAVKLLRRLACHGRSELATMRMMLARLRGED